MGDAKAGERIKYLREFNHYTREAFAAKIDISSKFLYEIESGKKGFSAQILVKIARALSVSTDYIMFGENENSLNMDHAVSILSKFDGKKIGHVTDIIQLIYDMEANA